ncbi:MAG TPA: lytic transglycosylase domain-containing protein [Polyangiaceae bacterium]
MRARLAVAALALVSSCRGGSAPESRPAAGPASAAVPYARAAGADGGSDDASMLLEQGMPRLAVVLDDPRLAAARDRARDKDYTAAASALDAAMATTHLDALHACEWAYVAGTLHAQADEHTEAAAAFERARGTPDDAGASCPLAPYATLRAAEELVHAGRFDEALARARAVVDDIAPRDEAKLALADSFVGKGNRTEAVPIWRELLAASPHGLRWADSSMQLATALLDGVDGPPDARAQEALDLVTRVLVEAPMVAEKIDVLGLRSRAATALRLPTNPPPLTPEERARQARAWFEANQPKRAVETAEALLKSLPTRDAKHHAAGCQAAIVRAQATPRGKSDVVADAWDSAIARCEGEDELVTALYFGAKASNSARRRDEALARFTRVEKLFPHHRYADDARLHAAQIVADGGDEARAMSMLAAVPSDYPDGDMQGEALFRVALTKLGHRDLDGARTTLDAILALPHDEHTATGTDRAAYFRARVAQLAGDGADAKSRYTALVSDHPLGYYMLLAYGRLRAIDAVAARAAVDAAVAREAAGPFVTRQHPELQSPAFERFQRLLEVGDVDDARREANAGGLVADGVDPEVLWTVAWCYDHADAPDAGHAYARARLSDWRAHWPAGRWRLAWEVAFPRPWQDAVAAESASAGIPEPLTWAIMREESAFNPDAKSIANAIGLMQLLVSTARLVSRGPTALATPIDEAALHKPELSIAIGARLLGSLRASFSEDKALAIAAYNGGGGAVRRWLTERGADEFDLFVERIPYDETRNYLKRVLASEAAYAYLYAPGVLEEVLGLPRRASGQEMIASP